MVIWLDPARWGHPAVLDACRHRSVQRACAAALSLLLATRLPSCGAESEQAQSDLKVRQRAIGEENADSVLIYLQSVGRFFLTENQMETWLTQNLMPLLVPVATYGDSLTNLAREYTRDTGELGTPTLTLRRRVLGRTCVSAGQSVRTLADRKETMLATFRRSFRDSLRAQAAAIDRLTRTVPRDPDLRAATRLLLEASVKRVTALDQLLESIYDLSDTAAKLLCQYVPSLLVVAESQSPSELDELETSLPALLGEVGRTLSRFPANFRMTVALGSDENLKKAAELLRSVLPPSPDPRRK